MDERLRIIIKLLVIRNRHGMNTSGNAIAKVMRDVASRATTYRDLKRGESLGFLWYAGDDYNQRWYPTDAGVDYLESWNELGLDGWR